MVKYLRLSRERPGFESPTESSFFSLFVCLFVFFLVSLSQLHGYIQCSNIFSFHIFFFVFLYSLFSSHSSKIFVCFLFFYYYFSNFIIHSTLYLPLCSLSCVWGCSSDGRAFALHARGSGIDARHLHFFLRFIVIWGSLLFFSLLVKVSLVKLFKYLHMFCVVVVLSLLVSVVWIVSIVHCFFLSFSWVTVFSFFYLFIYFWSLLWFLNCSSSSSSYSLYLLCHLIPLLIGCYSEISVSIVG